MLDKSSLDLNRTLETHGGKHERLRTLWLLHRSNNRMTDCRSRGDVSSNENGPRDTKKSVFRDRCHGCDEWFAS